MLAPKKWKTFPQQALFPLKAWTCWGLERLVLGDKFMETLTAAARGTSVDIYLSNFQVVAGARGAEVEKAQALKISRRRFDEFMKRTKMEPAFRSSANASSMNKQDQVRDVMFKLKKKWELEEQHREMARGFDDKANVPITKDLSRFRVAYRGAYLQITVRSAMNLSGGGFFDKLDPYCTVKLKGSIHQFKTNVLVDAGNDPIWEFEGTLVYNGEEALEFTVMDYDQGSSDDLVGIGNLSLEEFTEGFEGMVPLRNPQQKKKGKKQQTSQLVIGIDWEIPPELASMGVEDPDAD